MIKHCLSILSFLLLVTHSKGQPIAIDSLRKELSKVQDDTSRIFTLRHLTYAYGETKPDSSFYFAEQQLILSRKMKLKLAEVWALSEMGYCLLNMGNYPRSLQLLIAGLAIAEDPDSENKALPKEYSNLEEFPRRHVSPHIFRLDMQARVHHFLGILYGNANNHDKELFHYWQAKMLAEQTANFHDQCEIALTLGRTYLSQKKIDSALFYEQHAYRLAMQVGHNAYLGSIFLNLGRIQLAKGDTLAAQDNFRKAIDASSEYNYLRGVVAGNLMLAELARNSGEPDSSFYYANAAHTVAKILNVPSLLLRAYAALAGYFIAQKQNDSTVKYQQLIIQINDSLFNTKQVQQFQNIDFDEEQRQQEIETARRDYQDQLQKYLLLGGLTIFLLAAIFLWRTNRHRQKSNHILKQQKTEIELALVELKNTQKQLIQSEKMATLGELTAGIAHEIQNPLNFVNNFSELNTELLVEMGEEIGKGNFEEVRLIAKDIRENEERINQHGKRAAGIVKGMLQHSRSSSGQMEKVDINLLADEYLRLAYHGLRAKDSAYHATIKTDFDPALPYISVVPQDIGRVILNLITNAFYAVSERKKQDKDYEPTVTVSTRTENNMIVISVKDNGFGIDEKLRDKIFQPFFTTKPAGQGTGLGLSLSYDIVKAHGGELKVETVENKGSEFIIQLPKG